MQFKKNFCRPLVAAMSGTYGFWPSLGLALVVAVLGVSGFFAAADARLYDAFMRQAPDFSPAQRQVVLVESPLAAFGAGAVAWDELAHGLIARGAAQVVFTVAPEGEAAAALKGNPKVILARDAATMAKGSQPSADAVSGMAPALEGVHRRQQYAYDIGASRLPGLEAATAARLGVPVADAGSYLIDFRGGANGFARVSLHDLMGDGLVDDLVRDRVLLIGPGKERFHRTVATPVSGDGPGLSELEYHAYALDSLLRGKAISSLSPAASVFIVLFVWLACFLGLQSMSFRKAVGTASVLAAGLVLVSGLLLFAQIHVPVSAAILVIAASLVSVFHSKTRHQNQALARLVREAQASGLDRTGASGAQWGPAFWNDVLAMVDQILPLTRVVLLERIPGAGRVQEVAALRCSIETIRERRRDFTRAPYSSACEAGKAIELRNYLDDAPDGERQFLVPLMRGGEVLGFWAFGIDRSRMGERAQLMRAVDVLGRQLSDLLAQRRDGMARPGPAPVWREYLIDQRDLAIRQLGEHLQRLERHAHVLEETFNGLEAPAMVFDLFGRRLASNARMNALLKASDVNPDGQSAADLLEALCLLPAEEARSALVNVVFEGVSFERLARIGNARYLLHVSCLRNSTLPPRGASEMLQQLHGLMIQLFPLAERAAGRPATEETAEVAGTAETVEAAILASGAGSGARAAAAGTPDLEAVDALHEIETAIAASTSATEHEAVRFAVQGCRERTRVLANPRKLRSAFAALIQLLARDARQASQVTVTLNTEGDSLVVDMRNEGFGMPNEKLQAMLEDAGAHKSELLQRLRRTLDDALGKQGRVRIRSAVGSGYRVQATLPLAG